MIFQKFVKTRQLATVAPLITFLLLSACTGADSNFAREGVLSNSPNKLMESHSADGCDAGAMALLAQNSSGEPIELGAQELPRGLFLATMSELLLEKRDESAAVRLLVREVPGDKRGQIICSENLERLGENFEMSIAGLVKFTTIERPLGDGFVARQFYVYANGDQRGVILSNQRPTITDMDLRYWMSSGVSEGELRRLDDRTYLMKFIRERDGVVARLAVQLEYFPQN